MIHAMHRASLLLSASLIAGTTVASAAPPDVKSLVPSGGRQGETIEVTVAGKLGERPVQGWCSLEGVAITVPEEGEKLAIAIAADAAPGVCWIRLSNAEGASALKPFVVGTLPEVIEAEPNNEVEQAQRLETAQVVVNGSLEKSGDVDAFAVEVKQGETFVASLLAHETLGSPMDGILQVTTSRGFVLEQNDDSHGFDPQIVFTVPQDGTYLVRVFAFPAAPDSSIRLAGGADYRYRLTITTGAFADHAVPIAVPRGGTTPIRIVGWNVPADAVQLPISAGAEDRLLYASHPQIANAVPLRATAHPTGTEQEPNSREQPQRVELPASITGHADSPGDVDAFLLSATKGEKLSLSVEARSVGSPLDPVLRLLDATGKVVGENDDASRNAFDSQLAFTVPADGEYRVEVADRHGRGGERFVYLLTVALSEPDYTLSVAADAFTLAPGTPLEIPVTVTRTNGFEGEIEITAANLPEGVTAPPVKSLPKGDTSKTVKLVLTAEEGTTASGLFALVGRSSGEPALERRADAPITGLSARTEHTWLTVAPKK